MSAGITGSAVDLKMRYTLILRFQNSQEKKSLLYRTESGSASVSASCPCFLESSCGAGRKLVAAVWVAMSCPLQREEGNECLQ